MGEKPKLQMGKISGRAVLLNGRAVGQTIDEVPGARGQPFGSRELIQTGLFFAAVFNDQLRPVAGQAR